MILARLPLSTERPYLFAFITMINTKINPCVDIGNAPHPGSSTNSIALAGIWLWTWINNILEVILL